MFRDEEQQAAACEALCDLVGLSERFGPWTTDGPSVGLRRLIDEGGGALSTGERALLYVALTVWGRADLWPQDQVVSLDTLLHKLDNTRLGALGELLLALASGRSTELDAWIDRHARPPKGVA